MEIDDKLIVDMQMYLFSKLNKKYFGRIKSTSQDIMVSCPFHKEGQERKPSFGIKRFTDSRGVAGTCHCFSCGKTTDLLGMLRELLGSLYNPVEIDSKFGLATFMAQTQIIKEPTVLFKLPEKKSIVKEEILQHFRLYHPYLAQRGISEKTAKKYDLGYDSYNQHITFPIKDINAKCIGIGRRSVLKKEYFYPPEMTKPLYGLYELEYPINALWVVEGPFNLWSLSEWGKKGVALLGTGTSFQYEQLLKLKCDKYVLALDPDDAGRNGIRKLVRYMLDKMNTRAIYVADLPEGKDINDLTSDEFKYQLNILTYKEWSIKYKKN